MIDEWHVFRDGEKYALTRDDLCVHMAGPFARNGQPIKHLFSAIVPTGGKVDPDLIQQTFPEARVRGGVVLLSDSDLALIKLAAS